MWAQHLCLLCERVKTRLSYSHSSSPEVWYHLLPASPWAQRTLPLTPAIEKSSQWYLLGKAQPTYQQKFSHVPLTWTSMWNKYHARTRTNVVHLSHSWTIWKRWHPESVCLFIMFNKDVISITKCGKTRGNVSEISREFSKKFSKKNNAAHFHFSVNICDHSFVMSTLCTHLIYTQDTPYLWYNRLHSTSSSRASHIFHRRKWYATWTWQCPRPDVNLFRWTRTPRMPRRHSPYNTWCRTSPPERASRGRSGWNHAVLNHLHGELDSCSCSTAECVANTRGAEKPRDSWSVWPSAGTCTSWSGPKLKNIW